MLYFIDGFDYIGNENRGRRSIIHRFSPLQQAILDFLGEQHSAFHLNDLVRHLSAGGIAVKQRTEGRLIDLLHASYQLLSPDDLQFIPRRAFFQGARFLVVPTPEEVREGILIPGHRFLPFSFHDVLPWNCILRTSDGRTVRHRRVGRRIEDLLAHYTFFGLKNLPLMLARDHENNLEALQEDDIYTGSVQITAFDLKDMYGKSGFEAGDALVLTVEDWQLGRFRLEHLPAETGRLQGGDEREWIRRLEGGFHQAFERLGFPADMEEVIAYACFHGGRELFSRPALHLGGFLEKSDTVGLITVGTDTCLWRKGEDPEEVITSCCPVSVPRGDDDSLEAILNDLGLSISPEEIEACMRDELFHRGRDVEKVMARCFQGRSIEFVDPDQGRAFHSFIRELWEEVGAGYNYFADQTGGALRAQALELLDMHLGWLRSLDSRGLQPDDLPVRSLFEIGQGMGQIGQLLNALNHIENVPAQELDRMQDALKMLDRAIRERIGSVEEVLESCVPENPEVGLRLVRPDGSQRPASSSWYVLKVSLRGTHPPVWRRVRVPGSYSLADLHRVIQAVMGWQDCHLHSFLIEGVEYGDPHSAPDGFFQDEDESEVCLEELLRRELLRFRYEYDFGDGWEHLVAVEKILPCSAVEPTERERAVCLAGRRACPPEDCGGNGGYRRLLENLQDPSLRPQRASVRPIARRDRTGAETGFDPGRFSVEEINRRLRDLS